MLQRNDAGAWGLDDPAPGLVEHTVWRSTEIDANGTWTTDPDPAVRQLARREAAATRLDAGDLLITKASGSPRHIGKAALVDAGRASDGFSNFVQRLRLVPGQDPRYFWYLLNSSIARRHYDQLATTTSGLKNITGSLIADVPLPITQGTRQAGVSAFLDRECERIASLDGRLHDMTAVVEEALMAAIRDAIGFDRHESVQIRYLAKTGTGHTPSRTHPEWWKPEDRVIPWFTLADVHQIRGDDVDVVTETAEQVTQIGVANSSAVVHPADTVLLSRTASVGFSAVMGVEMAVSQDFMTWTCGPRLRPRYLLYALRASRPDLRRLMYGSTHMTIYMPDLLALRVPLPSVDDQDAAVQAIEQEVGRARELVKTTTETQTRLAEYRDSLITEAVTGQLDIASMSESEMNERAHQAAESVQPTAVIG